MKVTSRPREIRPPKEVALRVSATPLLLSKAYRIIKSCAELHAQDDAGAMREGVVQRESGRTESFASQFEQRSNCRSGK